MYNFPGSNTLIFADNFNNDFNSELIIILL